MIVELITTGEEVLSGQITDTNAVWLSRILGEHGLPVSRRTTVGDRLDALVACFRERTKEADIVIVNGGLGPTSDDLSAAAMAQAMDEPLQEFPAWIEAMTARFRKMDRPLTKANRKQAFLPRSAEILDNPIGTACGFAVSFQGSRIYFTPGVPNEMKRMVTHEILPDLQRRFGLKAATRLKRLHCFGIAESNLGEMLQNIPLNDGITLGYRAHLPTIEIKIMAVGDDEARLDREMARIAGEIRTLLGDRLICEDDHNLPTLIQEFMIDQGFSLALAESCTGGMIADWLVAVPGSSAYFERGYVTYSNRAKREMIDVPGSLIEAHGAVSLEVACAMAEGAKKRAGVSHALAVSGIAGPEGGTPEKPVGTVAFALAEPGATHGQVVRLPPWGRKAIRIMSVALALDMLRRHLLGQPVFGNFDLVRTNRTEVFPNS